MSFMPSIKLLKSRNSLVDAHIAHSLLRKTGHTFMWLKQATEGQSFLSADHVRTLQKSEIRRPLNHINNSPCNRDALCMGWNEVDREGLCAEDTTHTLGTQMRHHALKHHFKSNLDFSWPKEARDSGTLLSLSCQITQSLHPLCKPSRISANQIYCTNC